MDERMQDVKELVTLGASFGEGIAKTLDDGRVSLGDYRHFLPAVGDVLPAISGIENAIAKVKAGLSKEEREILVTHFKTEFDIPDDLVEEFTENSVQMAAISFRQYEIFKEMRARK